MSVYERGASYWVLISFGFIVLLLLMGVSIAAVLTTEWVLWAKALFLVAGLIFAAALIISVPKWVKRVEIKGDTIYIYPAFGGCRKVKNVKEMLLIGQFTNRKRLSAIQLKHQNGVDVIDLAYWFKTPEKLFEDLEKLTGLKLYHGFTGRHYTVE